MNLQAILTTLTLLLSIAAAMQNDTQTVNRSYKRKVHLQSSPHFHDRKDEVSLEKRSNEYNMMANQFQGSLYARHRPSNYFLKVDS